MTGDDKAQTDMSDYEGDNNGLRRAVEVFRGTELFGTVTLQTIFRSEIAKIAEKM
jgi:predicted ribonuclease YlaK